MSGIVTIARTSIDQVAGPIVIPRAATIRVNTLARRVFDVASAASSPAGARVQQRKVNTAINPLAANQTSLAHSTPLFTRTTLARPMTGSVDTTAWTTAVTFPIADTAHTLTRRYC